MPTIKEKLRFNFNGVWSDTYDLIHVVLDSGMFDENFVAQREIVETKMQRNNKPMLHHIEESPLEFEMAIAFEGTYTDALVDSIINWLFVDQYKPLYFEGKESKIYMALPIGEPRIVHNGLNQGYFTIQMRCDSPNIYSPVVLTSVNTVATTVTYTYVNDGHFVIYPEISIKKNGVGTVIIESLDDGGSIFEIRNLTNLEDVYVNCEKEIIETDLLGESRYDDLIGEFPRMKIGSNRFKVTGACTIQFRYKKKYRF